MLKIRTDQEDALADEDFVRRLVEYLQTRLPESTAKLTYRQLRSVVRHGIAVARTYRFENEDDLAAFTFDMLGVNPAFHRQPEIKAALEDPSTPIEDRIERATRASEAAWAEAARMTDAPAYWQHVLDSDPESQEDPT